MTTKKRILLIGDSIRMAYAPLVTEALADVAEVVQVKGNGMDSKNVRKKLKKWLKSAGEKTLDVVHFNCGLHDIKRKFGSTMRQQPIENYKENLHNIITMLKERTNAKLIWATTTPVIHERHHANKPFDRFEEDVEAYNDVALEIMKQFDILIDDLNKLIKNNDPSSCILQDGVHMSEKGNVILANGVTNLLQSIISG